MNIHDLNTAFPFGTGAFEDLSAGYSTPSNFFGQNGWWTVPTSWATMADASGQIWVSPNDDFSPPKYAVKINQAGEMVYFSMMKNLVSGNLRPC